MATKKLNVAKKAVPKKRAAKRAPKAHAFNAIEVVQGKHRLYLFTALASTLYQSVTINRRIEDKDEGYQRALSVSRVESIKRFIKSNRVIPGAVVISFDAAKFDKKKGLLQVPGGSDTGWVIDGQHRLAGAHLAAEDGSDIQLPVVAFLGLSETMQIEQFVVINREAKNVPTSLYLDLIGKLTHKKPADFAKERAVDLATALRMDEDSALYERIVVTTSPREGQVSLTNFVRKVAPHVTPDKGLLHIYTEQEQRAVIANYFRGLRTVFPKQFDAKNSVFFKTTGFGAVWNSFATVFSFAIRDHQGFQVKDVSAVLRTVKDFDFESWRQMGSGNQAELTAGEDFKSALIIANSSRSKPGALRV